MADELTPLTRIENFLAGNPQELEPLTRIEQFLAALAGGGGGGGAEIIDLRQYFNHNLATQFNIPDHWPASLIKLSDKVYLVNIKMNVSLIDTKNVEIFKDIPIDFKVAQNVCYPIGATTGLRWGTTRNISEGTSNIYVRVNGTSGSVSSGSVVSAFFALEVYE